MDKEIEKLVTAAMDERRFRKMRSNGMFLNDYQIEVLNRNRVPWERYNSIRGLLFYLEEILMNNENDELDRLSYDLQEQSYYQSTHK